MTSPASFFDPLRKAKPGTHRLEPPLGDDEATRYGAGLPDDLLAVLREHNGFRLFPNPDSPEGRLQFFGLAEGAAVQERIIARIADIEGDGDGLDADGQPGRWPHWRALSTDSNGGDAHLFYDTASRTYGLWEPEVGITEFGPNIEKALGWIADRFLRPKPEKWDLWATDGTVAGTMRQKEPNVPRGKVLGLCAAGRRYYFCIELAGFDTLSQVFITEGPCATTRQRAEFHHRKYAGMAALGEDCILALEEAEAVTLYLVKAEGFGHELNPVRRIEEPAGGDKPRHLTSALGQVLFVAYPPEGGARLWRTDGTPGGTVPLLDTAGQGPEHLIAFGGQVVFAAGQAGKKPKVSKGKRT